MTRGELRCEWRQRPPEPLPGPPPSHFQAPVGARQLQAQHDRPRWLVGLRGDRVLATWLFGEPASDPYLRPAARVARELDRHLIATHGPVLDPSLEAGDVQAVRAAMLDAVRARAARLRPISCALNLNAVLDEASRAEWTALARAAGFEVGDRHTYYVDLPGTVEEMEAAVKRERRKESRKGEKLGLRLERTDDLEAMRAYHSLRTATRLRNGHEPIPWSFWERTWHAFEGTGVMHLLTAWLGDRPGAGQLAFACNGYVYLVGVSIADWVRDERVPANDFLQMGVLKWAIESGQRTVDFVGADPGTDDPKIKAIDYFKSRWGTSLGTSLTLTLPGSRARARAAWAAGRVRR